MSKDDPLIDVHVHLYPDATTGRRAKESYQIWEYGADPGVLFDTADGVLGEVGDRYGDAGFDHAVVLQLFDVAVARRAALERLEPGLSGTDAAEAGRQLEAALVGALVDANRWVVESAAAHRLLTAYVCIDPCLLPEALLVPHLTEMAALGARGIKLHPVAQGYHPSDPRLAPVYDLCSELDLVVLSHSGPGHRGDATARPSDFAGVLGRWPQLRLVLAHLGGAAFAEVCELAADFPSVTFDLSEIIEWTGAANAPTARELSAVVREIGADRIMLGSDFPWYDPSVTAQRVASLPGLGAQERADLFGGTAVRCLDLEDRLT